MLSITQDYLIWDADGITKAIRRDKLVGHGLTADDALHLGMLSFGYGQFYVESSGESDEEVFRLSPEIGWHLTAPHRFTTNDIAKTSWDGSVVFNKELSNASGSRASESSFCVARAAHESVSLFEMRVLRWSARRKKIKALTLLRDAFMIEPLPSIEEAIEHLRAQIDHSCIPM